MTAPPQMNNAAAFRMLNRFTDCPTGPDDYRIYAIGGMERRCVK
jgi:hypothetical protein